MSKLIFNSPILVFYKDVAKILGLKEALILQQIHQQLEVNKKVGRNFYENKYWILNSISDWRKKFPFWSLTTFERVFRKMRKQGFLLTANFNQIKADRRLWYTIDYHALKLKKVNFRQFENIENHILQGERKDKNEQNS